MPTEHENHPHPQKKRVFYKNYARKGSLDCKIAREDTQRLDWINPLSQMSSERNI